MQTSQTLGNKIICSKDAHKNQNQQIIALCLTDICQSKRTLCSLCADEHDKTHKIIFLQQLQPLLEEQSLYISKKIEEQQINLENQQLECLREMDKKIKEIGRQALNVRQISCQKINQEKNQRLVNQYKNEEDLQRLSIELQDKINDDPYNPKLIKLLYRKNIFYGYERFNRQLVFDYSVMASNLDFFKQSNYFSHEQYVTLENLKAQISNIRAQIIVGFQDEEENLVQLQQFQDEENIQYSMYVDKKLQNNNLNDEQIQQINNLMRLPIGQILQNYPIEILKNQQFTILLEKPLSSPLLLNDIKQMNALVKDTTLICFGAIKNSDPSNFTLCAIDYADEIFSQTDNFKLARKSKKGQIYWYYKYGMFCGIIGFSPTQDIDIGHMLNYHSDRFNENDNQRFSLQIDYNSFCRVGKEYKLLDSREYQWAFYIRK